MIFHEKPLLTSWLGAGMVILSVVGVGVIKWRQTIAQRYTGMKSTILLFFQGLPRLEKV